ncbi:MULTISPECIES: Na+/H+ antiporter NhaA [unclassified Rhodococcus (in: high G+C Gram-positive bacteria)]|uniref:Na+/H+ antiporter NhaA n=1 Tax=unclassified Rhodococcus (in: high G+C Gram-positive bacteria) TaxID=192944 RepID=UPI0002A313E3|nr:MULTISPECIES: Na+/H+ antiporter NhaA [unclassified Rhodococcus (in: high G+C Gram-positive bacteria)]ELB94776.1 Na+/H+ antiporter NhaA [Rhodococcus wratislaviensis IFP 2016]MBC2645020.1 Na+/H+ antiporter NhaA [Rhodococcus sp. 3A]MBC2898093.1 Na+/H+ antiporter NhaA [Rhodococcus sp. 4CII]
MNTRPTATPLFPRGSWAEASRITEILRKETVGGALLLLATVAAMVWANSPWSSGYDALRDFTIGPEALHLNLSIGTWAADGLLAIFFFVVGLELKREFVAGDLRDPRRAALPIAAAVGGMAAPAVVFVAVNARTGGDALQGWAIPTATDIAFALAVLAVINTHLPSTLRTFLLTLAVVDDLLAITIIAVFYTDKLSVLPLLAALIPLAAFTIAVQRRIRSWWLLLPLAALTWALVHASGVHATVAGVLLGFAVPVLRSRAAGGPDAGPGLAEHFEHRIRPISAGFAVPVFAFFAAGVTIGGLTGLTDALSDPIAVGIIAGLIVGKTCGIFGTTYLLSRFTRATLDAGLRWIDVLGVAILAGIGFTVSLLIGELAYGQASAADDHVKIGVLCGSVVAAVVAAAVLRIRNRAYRLIAEQETVDADGDGIPDVYQHNDGRDIVS